LAADGSRLFFESFESLVPRDTNEARDLYEFEQSGVGSCNPEAPSFADEANGCVFLVSTGESGDSSYFIDASSSGRDVFLSTRQALVGGDGDKRFDVYDARVDGGFVEPLPPPAPCTGEGCRPVAPAEGDESVPGSSDFNGEGNAKPKRCAKGKVRRNGRCVRRRHDRGNGRNRRDHTSRGGQK
jgi:hypothetical protein